ncbi:TonB-dependent receptor domain-containing protein [Croceivirga sp. JEA036]|uniref:TonB-dependent receptor domain-containing protein n=1 Tax=Croceivirga sp. JEA036 TaxID=2721162 RepID=UPI001438A616|nr:TonB-dependent receptor [Croceivirga sp. JEA036]NJB37498.1 TonB-dependent receptor [Croceivirga sp. JEA036]
MRLQVFNALFALFIATTTWAQLTITGTVKNQEGATIADAEVYLKELQELQTTDDKGTFAFTDIPVGKYTILVFSLEYEVYEKELTFDQPFSVDITLKPLQAQQLSEVVLSQQREKVFALQKLKTVEGTAIYAGKKSEVVLMDNLVGNLAANNPRQIYNQVVGLNIFDYGDAGLQLNIGGRGLDPNRSANFNTRQNGYDISADALGYPESYYSPPAEALEQIQVVRGAASLQYGPQFGGLINFVFKKPNPTKKIELISRQTVGSYDLFTSFNSLSGTTGKLSYYTFFNYKQGSSFRPNSDFSSRNFHTHVGYQLSDKTKLSGEVTLLDYLAQQPGGLTDAQFIEDPSFSNRERNWFDIDWKLYNLKLEHSFSVQTDFSLSLTGLQASRSALGFRTNRVSQLDDTEEPRELLVDDFSNIGAEARVLHRYKIQDKDAIALLGVKYYQTYNEQQQGPGSAAANADFNFATTEFPDYERQSSFTFPNLNFAVFGEHIFNLNKKFSVTPGFRWEYINTESNGTYKNIVKDLAGNTLLNEEIADDRNFERNFFLLGLGLSYKPNSNLEFYGNFSENYRSITFSDIRVVNPSFQIDPNISDESGFTADFGARGRISDVLSYDASIFGLYYDDRLGEILEEETRTNSQGQEVPTGRIVRKRGNIGTAFIYGLETFADVNLKSLLNFKSDKIKLNYFANMALTASEYVDSERIGVAGNEVEFIPDVNLKTGLSFGYGNLLGSLQYTYLEQQFTDATNAEQDRTDNQRGIEGAIPAYDILDFSLSYTYKRYKLEAGINNLLDTTYFTRRATGYPGPGIIPAEPRTFYATLQIKI